MVRPFFLPGPGALPELSLVRDYLFGPGHGQRIQGQPLPLHYNSKPAWGFQWLEDKPASAPTLNYGHGLNSDVPDNKADALMLAHAHRWTDGSSLETTMQDGYYSGAM